MDYERLRCGCATVLVVAACTVTNDGSGFTSTPTTAMTISTTVTDGDSGDASSETGGSTTAGDDGSTSGGLETSGGGSTSLTTLDGSSSDTAVDPTDGQPLDGMWSMCVAGADCGNPGFCITNADMTDGFCSATGCTNPAMNCLPSPGGTAMPACAPITVDGMDEMACVLSCTGGLVCPTGMVCMNFTDLGMICM